MAISKDTPRHYDPSIAPIFVDVPVKAATTLYEGSALTDDGGNGEADNLAASENFLGFLEKHADNSSGAAGDIRAHIRQQGVIKNVAVTGLDANTDFGVDVYASDNGTFTLTSSTTFVKIGKVQSWNGVTNYGDVFFQGLAVRSI